MKKIIYFFLLMIIGHTALAQSLKGKILDQLNTPISDAYIFLTSIVLLEQEQE